MCRYLILILILTTYPTLASDPFSTTYRSTEGSAKNLTSSELEGSEEAGRNREELDLFEFFSFKTDGENADRVLGSLSASVGSGSQTIKFNAINYNLWLGGDIKIPFQIYLGTTASATGDDSEKANSATILDPESGLAIKLPFIWTYKGILIEDKPQGICSFGKGDTIGRCALGGDLTFNFKDLEQIDNDNEYAYGHTIRAGGSALFPILNATGDEKGYLSLSIKAVYSYTNIDDSTELFAPIQDANGNTISFKNNIFSSEFAIKWSLDQQFSLAATWVKPFTNTDYLDDQFALTIENKFN
ncbi:hypothetical protein CSB62_15120 [Vibrio splendidus]|uniref:hypothetical protein n=1 Tax=Vibrio celticus TaxID=446372 RepID=UPI000C0774A8|nr:hypothetical protein CSB62_15120 [Vibrio splendidus]